MYLLGVFLCIGEYFLRGPLKKPEINNIINTSMLQLVIMVHINNHQHINPSKPHTEPPTRQRAHRLNLPLLSQE
jgi:hypothetical protein